MAFKVTILGSGPSQGLPILACHCAVCSSSHPRNKRLRTSILITTETGANILVDTTPDVRQQLLREKVERIDAIIYTHIHADHSHGIDDLRPYYFLQKGPLLAYMHPSHQTEFKTRFDYLFNSSQYQGQSLKLDLHPIPSQPFQILGLTFETLLLPHGGDVTVAFKVGRFAYATDFKAFTQLQIAGWRGKLDTVIASALRYESHPTHSSIPETLNLFNDLEVKRGVIIHATHDVDYVQASASLPPGRDLAYDGMVIDALT